MAARKFLDILLPVLSKRSKDPGQCLSVLSFSFRGPVWSHVLALFLRLRFFLVAEICVGSLQIIKDIVEPLGSESSKKIVKSVSPLVISAGLDVRTSICDVLDAVAENDSSVHPTVLLDHLVFF